MADIIVIGAGAAGLMAAGTAASMGASVALIERNQRPARKVMITGKGRCNVSNNCKSVQEFIANVPSNGRFLFGSLSRFGVEDTVEFFESRGVPLKVERGNRIFPVSDKAVDIADCLSDYALKSGCRMINGRAASLVIEDGRCVGAELESGEIIRTNKVILATGGVSYPLTGSTGDGYGMAEKAGHTVTPLHPSLVPLEAHEGFCSSLQGLSLRNVSIRVIDTVKNKEVYSDFGEMLFTHFGVSGPLILSASSHMQDMSRGRYVISIDLKPALDRETLDARILRDFSENINRNYINALDGLLPKKLVPVIASLSRIPISLKVNQITHVQRAGLVELLKDFRITVTDFRPIEEAIITGGGVKVSEINPGTMESKLVSGLYFAGEVIDVDAYTGGFNLQIAFSTGHLAGESAAKEIME